MLSVRELRHLADYVEMNHFYNAWGDGTETHPWCPASFAAINRNMSKEFPHWFSANPKAMAVAMPKAPSISGASAIFGWLSREFGMYFRGPSSIFTYGDDRKESQRGLFAGALRTSAEQKEKAEHEAMVNPCQVKPTGDAMVTVITPIEWELTTVTA